MKKDLHIAQQWFTNEPDKERRREEIKRGLHLFEDLTEIINNLISQTYDEIEKMNSGVCSSEDLRAKISYVQALKKIKGYIPHSNQEE